MLSSRPHVINSNRSLKIRLESSKPANLVIDGQKTIDLGRSGTLEVRKAKKPALFIDVNRNFFEKVDNKLGKL
jgi:NAD+ kinase